MRSFAVIAGFFAVSAIASPLGVAKRSDNATEPCDDDAPPCLTYAQASTVADHFKSLIDAYTDELADEYLTVDFTDYSDSVTELINSGCQGPDELGVATFDSRAAFKVGQGGQPLIPFELLNLWHNCDTVVMRWRTTVSENSTEIVTGIIVLETEYTNGEFLIDTVYSEFNSGAWLVDLGVFVPTCDADGNAVTSNSTSKRDVNGHARLY